MIFPNISILAHPSAIVISPEALPLLYSIVSDKIHRNNRLLKSAQFSADCAERGVAEKVIKQPRDAPSTNIYEVDERDYTSKEVADLF